MPRYYDESEEEKAISLIIRIALVIAIVMTIMQECGGIEVCKPINKQQNDSTTSSVFPRG